MLVVGKYLAGGTGPRITAWPARPDVRGELMVWLRHFEVCGMAVDV